jgi:AcrR family transcriptional regulator
VPDVTLQFLMHLEHRDMGLRERKMLKLRAQLIDAALSLFTTTGFEATSVDDIVAKVEVSRRTFFRYFNSKEDVVLAFTDRVGEEIRTWLAARPEGEPPLTAVRRAIGPLVQLYAAEKDRALLLVKLTDDATALRARHLDRQDRWKRWLADEIAKRLKMDGERDLHPQLVAAVALTTIDVAVRAWLVGGGHDSLESLVNDAFAALESGLDREPAAANRAATDRVSEQIRTGLAARPKAESPLTAVRRAVGPLVELYSVEKERALLLARQTDEGTAIRARHLDRQDRWKPWLAEEIAKRLNLDARRDLHPQLLAAVALTTIDVAVRAWLAGGGSEDLGTLVNAAFASLEGGLDREPPAVPAARAGKPALPVPAKRSPRARQAKR